MNQTEVNETIARICRDTAPGVYVPDPKPARTIDLGWCRRTWDKFTSWEREARITAWRPERT